MPIQMVRTRTAPGGTFHRRHVSYRNLELDRWYRAELVYSRELARARLRVYQVSSKGEKLIGRAMLPNLPPFDPALPYALGFQSRPVSPETVMKAHLREVVFETAAVSAPADWRRLKGRNKGFAALSLGLFAEARDLLAPEIAKDRSGVLRFLYRHACLRSGRTREARTQEDWLFENRNSLPPFFYDRLGWWTPLLGEEASDLLEKLRKK